MQNFKIIKNYKLLTLKDAVAWKRYIGFLPQNQQDIYYTPEYYSLYENYGDGKAMCFVFEKAGDIALYPFLLNSVNELGYDLEDKYFDIQGAYGYNGVLSSNYSASFIQEFYDSFTAFCKDHKIIAEFTRFNPLLQNEKFSPENYQVIFDRKTVKLDYSKYNSIAEILENSYDKQARKNCRKAIKQGLSFSIANELAAYESFYKLYCNTMDHIGSNNYYYFNLQLFKDLFNNMKSFHQLILVGYKGELVGGFVLFHFGKYAHNYLSAGSFAHRNLNINDYMQDIAIGIAFEKECSMLHFGGGNSDDENDPLFRFKAKFSKERAAFYIGKKIHNAEIYTKVVTQWKERLPELYNLHKFKVLGYREK